MLGFLFLCLGSLLGWELLLLVRRSNQCNPIGPIPNRAVVTTGHMVWVAGSFFVGTLTISWMTYLLSYLFRRAASPMVWGNALSMGIVAIFLVVNRALRTNGLQHEHVRRQPLHFLKSSKTDSRLGSFHDWLPELLLLVVLLACSSLLMFGTFFFKDNALNISFTTFGDIGPHLAMIRSFSQGLNFPTEYPFFSGEGIRYHFMFQFLCGNLEFLGMRIDWAFNLPSLISYTLSLLLLHALATRLTGLRATGFLAIGFFVFRSYFGFFKAFHEAVATGASIGKILSGFMKQTEFINLSSHDDWGMWNQNVFINQRHLMFSVGILLLILCLMLPRFEEMTAALGKQSAQGQPHAANRQRKEKQSLAAGLLRKGKLFAFSRDAWLPQSIAVPVFCGLLLGGIGFWNGAVVIAAMPILFFMALASGRRLEYLVIVLIAGILVLLQSSFFSGVGAGIVSPKITPWFLAEVQTWPGLADYLTRLLGIMPLLLFLSFSVHAIRRNGWLFLSFSSPFVMAFLLQLTPDLAVNHKYITLSVMLLNILAADFIVQLWAKHRVRMLAAVLTVIMIIGGMLDLVILYNRNQPKPEKGIVSFVESQTNPFYLHIRDKTPRDALFLTDTLFIHPILTAGRRVVLGWVYYSWSAGYDTDAREAIVKEILSAPDAGTLKHLVAAYGIDYILIDDGMRNREDFPINEALIAQTYPIDYQSESGSDILYKVVD